MPKRSVFNPILEARLVPLQETCGDCTLGVVHRRRNYESRFSEFSACHDFTNIRTACRNGAGHSARESLAFRMWLDRSIGLTRRKKSLLIYYLKETFNCPRVPRLTPKGATLSHPHTVKGTQCIGKPPALQLDVRVLRVRQGQHEVRLPDLQTLRTILQRLFGRGCRMSIRTM